MNDAAEIFKTWGRIGWPGQWYFNSSSKTIINRENTDNFTGFYYPHSFDYRNIDFSYDNGSWDGDDDVMGSMVKFNQNADGTVTTYVFALKNSISGGWPNEVRGGLYKIQGKAFEYQSIQPLQEINKTWPRGQWVKYHVVAKDNNIKVYMNGQEVINYTDTNQPIRTGSYGFFSCSQPYAQYGNVTIVSENTKSFVQVLQDVKWREEAQHFVINLNEDEEAAFATQESTQQVLAQCQADNVHYIGWGSSKNTAITKAFIEANEEQGTFVSTEDYSAAIKKIVDFVIFHVIYENGTGTVTHPFVIENAEQLTSMKYNLDAYYELSEDIDLEGQMWAPIGKYDAAFTGHFNGHGKTISHFTINAPGESYLGFFGVTKDACIQDVTLEDVNIYGTDYVGSLIGYASGSNQIISNCFVNESTVKGHNFVGGLMGYLENGEVLTCESLVEVEGNIHIGGLIGYGYGMIIKDCTSFATVIGAEDVGGLMAIK